MIEPAAQGLRPRAEALGAALPALLAAADHLAATVILGEHGRRRAGMGDEFWQYRPSHSWDSQRMIDWRRSARSDAHFVREREWQAAQTVTLWVDAGRSMTFTGDKGRETKAERARLLALALAVLLLRGGERVGLASDAAPPRSGRAQVLRIAEALETADEADYAAPAATGLAAQGRAVFISDFLGDMAGVEAVIGRATDRGIRGALVQVLDPAEEDFPFDGRTIFESMGGSLRHETLRARDLRSRYLDRLAARKARLEVLCRASGWQYHCHHTGQGAQSALLWLYRALEAGS